MKYSLSEMWFNIPIILPIKKKKTYIQIVIKTYLDKEKRNKNNDS